MREKSEAVNSKAMTPKNILIVDDDADFRANLEDILLDEGYTPVAVGLCSEGLNLAREREPARPARS